MADADQIEQVTQECERMAEDHIAQYRAWEQREMATRLMQAVLTQDHIRQQVAELVQVAEPYVTQEEFSDMTKAERLAEALLGLRDAMLHPQQCQEIDELGGNLENRLHRLAQEQGPMIRRTLEQEAILHLIEREDDKLHGPLCTLARAVQAWVPFDDHETSDLQGRYHDHAAADRKLAAALYGVLDTLTMAEIDRSAERLADRLQAELRQETPAYRAPGRRRLYRLCSYVEQWQDRMPGEDEREQLLGISAELLLLCEHLGITGRQPETTATHGIRPSAEQLAEVILVQTPIEKTSAAMRTLARLGRLICNALLFPDPERGIGEREQIVGICTELLLLCEHLRNGVDARQPDAAAGGAT